MNIVKGRNFQADFVVKQNGSTTALVLNSSDTGNITFFTTGVNPERKLTKDLILTSADMGTFTLYLTPEETIMVETRVGFGEDNSPIISTYKASLDFTTVSQGYMSALINDIYITDIGV
jgi:hypothetical protein